MAAGTPVHGRDRGSSRRKQGNRGAEPYSGTFPHTRTYRTNHRGQHGELAQLRAAQYSGGVPFGSSL
ncbi:MULTISPECIES: hypothetical protein [Bacteroides]|uniref:hypothetical protein n=1 Tax=Bacteroides TaxID=816 RepID=UPI003568CEFC|nr:hypothetical protein [Bacteroides ovatus]